MRGVYVVLIPLIAAMPLAGQRHGRPDGAYAHSSRLPAELILSAQNSHVKIRVQAADLSELRKSTLVGSDVRLD